MIRQYREGVVPASGGSPEIAALAAQIAETAIQAFDNFDFSKGLEAVWALLGAVDKYIVAQAPWAKADGRDETLYTAAEVLRIACILLYPVIPGSITKIWEQLGMTGEPQLEGLRWGQLQAGQKIGTVAAVFPRIEAAPAIAKMRALEVEETARQAALLGKTAAPASGLISIDEFAKVEMRVGLVLAAERVKGADKLLQMKIDIGEAEPRNIVAGIAEAYTPEEMLGRKVVIVANLQPRKLRGLVSNGMILAASPEGGKPVLVSVAGDVAPGAKLR
jgi:methionyl-tRNA synthetase